MPEQKLPDELVKAIGRVAVNGARLELDITVLLCGALGHAAPTRRKGVGKVQIAPDQFSRVVDYLKLVAKARLTGNLLMQFRDFLAASGSVMGQRHRVVHGSWTVAVDNLARHTCSGLRVNPVTGRPLADSWSAADVHAIADHIHETRGTFNDLIPRLVVALPELAQTTIKGAPPPELHRALPGVA